MVQQEAMKQWITNQDGLDKLSLEDVPKPAPKDNEVLVKVLAVSLNFRDTEVAMGLYNHHKSTQDSTNRIVPCSDMCGEIIHSKAPNLPSGTRVLSIFNQSHLKGQIRPQDMSSGLGLPLPGVLTQYRCFPASTLVPCPSYLAPEQACNLPIATVTAWMALNWHRPLNSPFSPTQSSPVSSPETILLQGTGGVSIAGLQLAHAANLRTIILSSSDAKLLRAKTDLGATHTINYKSDPNWEQTVMELTGGEGVDVVFETGGAATLRKSFDCVKFGGMIACIGYLGGKESDRKEGEKDLHTNVLALRRNVTIKGLINGPKERFEEALRFCEEKRIKPVVDRVFPFEDAGEAFRYLFSGGHFGKVVVRVA